MKNPYKRLPGRRWLTIGLISKLWLGSDHLLAVSGSRYNENYQRFDFRDIQALVNRRTRRRLAISLALGIPAALILLVGATRGWSGVAAGLPVSGPLLLALLANVLRGPTCVSHLRTAVSVVELPSLARVRSFERAARVLRPHLEAAQGSLAPEEFEKRLATMPPAPPAPQTPPAVTFTLPERKVRPYRGAAHDALFGLLIALGLVGLLRALVSSHAIMVVAGALILAVILALVAALVRQQETDLAPRVKRVVWAAIAYFVSAFSLFYVAMGVDFVQQAMTNQHRARAERQDAVFQYIVGGAETPAGLLSIALSLVGIGIGIAGALRLRSFRAARRAAGRHTPPLHP